MLCSEIIKTLEEHSPGRYAESWDNVGLLAGRPGKEVSSVMITLDATDAVINETVSCNADMIIAHHPLIFSPIKKVTDEDFIGRRIVSLLQHDICCYAMHTNFDVFGMADAAADDLQLTNRQVLLVTLEEDGVTEGIGRTGNLPKPMKLSECADFVKKVFDVPNVRVYGDLNAEIKTVAVCPGSGGSAVEDALRLSCDVLITGDINYHTGIDAVARSLNIIDAGHYGIEKLFIPYMRDFIKRELPELEIFTAPIREPFTVL